MKKYNNKSFNNYYFKYDNEYKNMQNTEMNDFFGIRKVNRLEELLKSVPRHKKENTKNNSYNELLKLYKNKKNENKTVKKKMGINLFYNKRKSLNQELHKIMPPNMIN